MRKRSVFEAFDEERLDTRESREAAWVGGYDVVAMVGVSVWGIFFPSANARRGLCRLVCERDCSQVEWRVGCEGGGEFGRLKSAGDVAGVVKDCAKRALFGLPTAERRAVRGNEVRRELGDSCRGVEYGRKVDGIKGSVVKRKSTLRSFILFRF